MPVGVPRTANEGVGALTVALTLVLAVLGLGTSGTPDLARVESSSEQVAATRVEAPPPAEDPVARPVHVVEEGDTLSSLAARTGTTVEDILEVNELEDPGALSLGQEITLPDGATPPPQPLDPQAPAVELHLPLMVPSAPAAKVDAELP